MAGSESDAHLLDSVAAACELLARRLNTSLPEMQNTLKGRLLYGFAAFPAIAAHRIHDFSTAALALYKQGRLAPASTLTRSVFETTAVFVYLMRKLRAAIESRDLREFGELAARSVWGSRNETTQLKAIQALTAIDHLDAEGTRKGVGSLLLTASRRFR